MRRFKQVSVLLAGILLFGSGWVLGQQKAVTQKGLMHVFAYTSVPAATPQDFDNFKKASAELAGKIPGLRRIWVGKLRRPLTIGEAKREYGVAMEFDDEKALDDYAKNPDHDAWVKAYEKVRVEGTTTYDILAE
jgi:hypothetical protein